jgi:hypothetical protein
MEIGDLLVRGTIWLSLLAWVVGEWRRSAHRGTKAAGRTEWTAGALAALGHAAAAFHLRHGWSHSAALAETARQTAAVTGLDWGGGIYVNYLSLAVWTADAGWWWLNPETFGRRPKALDRVVRTFPLFMFVNGAVVFGQGPIRVAGTAAVLAVIAAWYRGRGAQRADHG